MILPWKNVRDLNESIINAGLQVDCRIRIFPEALVCTLSAKCFEIRVRKGETFKNSIFVDFQHFGIWISIQSGLDFRPVL